MLNIKNVLFVIIEREKIITSTYTSVITNFCIYYELNDRRVNLYYYSSVLIL